MEAIRTAWEAPELRSGLVPGVLMATLAAVVALAAAGLRSTVGATWRRRLRIRSSSRRLPGVAGPAFVVAGVIGLRDVAASQAVPRIPDATIWALLLVWAGVALAGRTRWPLPVGMALALPGAWWLLADQTLPGPGWIPWAVVGGTVLLGPLAAEGDRDLGRTGVGPLLLLITVGGIYATVPDTELALPLLGAALPVALLGVPFRLARVGDGGIAAATGLLLWMTAYEGWARPGAVVGALGCLGVFVGMPIGRRLRSRIPIELPWRRGRRAAAVVVGQLVVVFWASRVAGLQQDALTAALLLLPALVAAVVLGAALPLGRRTAPRSSRGSPSAAA